MIQSWARILDRHWFDPASLRDLAWVRIVIAGSALLFFRHDLAPHLSYVQADPSTFQPLPALKVLMLPFGGWGIRPEATLLHGVWLLSIVSAALATIGFGTRLALLALAASYTLLEAHLYSFGEVHHGPAILAIMLWVLAVAPCGEALSVDGLRRRIDRSLARMRFEPITSAEERSEHARWPLRVGQWLLVLIYLSAGLSKLANGGLQWFNGYTLSYYLLQDAVRWGSGLALALAEVPLVNAAISVFAVGFELSFVLAVLVPRLTWPYLLAGAGLHTGIYVLQHAPFFQFIAVYAVFMEPLRETWPLRFRLASAQPWTVVYDGLCPLCIRSAVILDYLDLRRQLRFVDLEHEWATAVAIAPTLTAERARAAIHLVSPDGQVYSGFTAFRALSRQLPLLWPVLPLLYAPLSGRVGPRLYRLVAASRGRVVCRADSCAV
jgi:predicted DCC family thiol-disulfide oxidoreductase YuxK